VRDAAPDNIQPELAKVDMFPSLSKALETVETEKGIVEFNPDNEREETNVVLLDGMVTEEQDV